MKHTTMLRGIDFRPVWIGAGTLNFYGEGFPYQKLLYDYFRWCDFTGVTFVAKTITVEARRGKEKGEKGNMRLNLDGSISLWPLKPSCIKISPLFGTPVNAVGLSNLGAKAHFNDGRWQKLDKPFQISFAAVGETKEKRHEERRMFVAEAGKHISHFCAVAIQENYSCPNAVHRFPSEIKALTEEMHEGLAILSELGAPLLVKVNAFFPISAAVEIDSDQHCDGFCVSNTIPWGERPEEIPWNRLFLYSLIFRRSPLWQLGGGGLSGERVRPFSLRWIKEARDAGVKKHINGGGGILKPVHVDMFRDAGADSVFISSISFKRPWNVQPVIRRGYDRFNK